MIQVCDVPLMSLIPVFHFPKHGVSYASRAWGQNQQYKYCNVIFHSYSYMQMVVIIWLLLYSLLLLFCFLVLFGTE